MSRTVRTLLGIAVALGLLLVTLAGEAKPPAPAPTTCPTCPIVYSLVGSDKADLMLMQADGTGKTLLLAGAKGISHTMPAWSPDGEWVVFSSNLGGAYGLWLIRNDGTGLQKVISTNTLFNAPHWQAGDGPAYWLAYQDMVPNGSQLYAVRVQPGTDPVALEKTCLTCEWSQSDPGEPEAAWSEVAFTGDGLHLLTFKWDWSERIGPILFDFDGDTPALGNPLFVDPSAFGMSSPMSGHHSAWSHSGHTLIAKDEISSALWSIEADHDADPPVSAAVNLTGADYSDCQFSRPRWSPDDTRIVYMARNCNGWGIFVAPVAVPFVHPPGPIAKSFTNSQASYPDWKPVP